MVGVAAGALCKAGCARIHSGEPHVTSALALFLSPAKDICGKKPCNFLAGQCLCGLACEELLGDEAMTKVRI